MYSAQNVIDLFQGTFDIPCDGVESDIESFEDDIPDVVESLDSIPMEEDEEDLPRFPDEISEDEDSDSSEYRNSGKEERERGRPARFTFENIAWSEQRSEIDIALSHLLLLREEYLGQKK